MSMDLFGMPQISLADAERMAVARVAGLDQAIRAVGATTCTGVVLNETRTVWLALADRLGRHTRPDSPCPDGTRCALASAAAIFVSEHRKRHDRPSGLELGAVEAIAGLIGITTTSDIERAIRNLGGGGRG